MKSKLFLILPLLCLFFLPLQTNVYSQTKTTIAVLSFEAKNVNQETADAVADILSTELFNTNRFNVVERQSINSILQEQKLQMAGITDMSKAAEIGKMLNVQKIMMGSVSRLGKTYFINTRLVDVETGALELAQKAKSTTGEDGLPAAIADLVKQISQKVTVEGSIIRIAKGLILIDLGTKNGIHSDQILDVIRTGDVITDLGGTIIGKSEDFVARLKVISAKETYAETQVVESKMPVKVGDKVRLVTTSANAPKKKEKDKKTSKKEPATPPPVF